MKPSDRHGSQRRQLVAAANGNTRPPANLPIHPGGMTGTVARSRSGGPDIRNRLVRDDIVDT